MVKMPKGSYLKGIPKTEEWKKKVFTKKYAENMSKIKIGHSTSKETKDKISKANKSRHLTPQTEFKKGHKINVGNKYHLGKHLSEETKKKLSLINSGENNGFYGKRHNEETKKIMKEKRKLLIVPFKDTSIEIKIQNFLKQLGIEFFTHHYIKIKYGYQCDILIPIQNRIDKPTIIECDGDYWHGNTEKKNFIEYPQRQRQQRILDFERTNQLEEQGYRVIRLWGSQIKSMEINNLKKEFP